MVTADEAVAVDPNGGSHSRNGGGGGGGGIFARFASFAGGGVDRHNRSSSANQPAAAAGAAVGSAATAAATATAIGRPGPGTHTVAALRGALRVIDWAAEMTHRGALDAMGMRGVVSAAALIHRVARRDAPASHLRKSLVTAGDVHLFTPQ